MYSKQHLLNELNELEKDYTYKQKVLNGLRNQLRVQISIAVEEKLSLNYKIEEKQKELNKLDLQITLLRTKIDSSKKFSSSDISDEFFEKNQIRISLDAYSYQITSDGHKETNTKEKAYTTLRKLRSIQKEDSRVSDGLKDDNRKIYKKGKYGEQILLKEDDQIFADDILESRPDAIKG